MWTAQTSNLHHHLPLRHWSCGWARTPLPHSPLRPLSSFSLMWVCSLHQSGYHSYLSRKPCPQFYEYINFFRMWNKWSTPQCFQRKYVFGFSSPIVTSKLIGLSPIFLSIIVASKKDPKRKNSSIFPVALCKMMKMCDRQNRIQTASFWSTVWKVISYSLLYLQTWIGFPKSDRRM